MPCLAPRSVNATALCYHYSHMARGNAREYLFNDKVRLKKYFYVLRPLLAIRYIEHGKGIVAPDEIRASIVALLKLKRNTEELGLGDPIPEIGRFIESELERHGTLFSGQGRPDLLDNDLIRSELNTVFRSAISGASTGAA